MSTMSTGLRNRLKQFGRRVSTFTLVAHANLAPPALPAPPGSALLLLLKLLLLLILILLTVRPGPYDLTCVSPAGVVRCVCLSSSSVHD